MMKMKVQALLGASLDWAVALARFDDGRAVSPHCGNSVVVETAPGSGVQFRFNPSANREQGGEIIESEGIATRKHLASNRWFAMSSADLGDAQTADWAEFTARGGKRYGVYSYQVELRRQRFDGPTQLVAGLRCHVALRLGDVVDVPDELAESEIGGNEVQNDDVDDSPDRGEDGPAERHAP
jgi:hypothetical protein